MRTSTDATLLSKTNFHKLGGVVQLNFNRLEDLEFIPSLDPRYWVAVACPTQGHEFDDTSLKYLDWDDDGRIRLEDIQKATQWLIDSFKEPSNYHKTNPLIDYNSIDSETQSGEELIKALNTINILLDKDPNTDYSKLDSSKAYDYLSHSIFNGDGVIQSNSTEDESIKQLINEIQSTVGKPETNGITVTDIELFFNSAKSYSEWYNSGQSNDTLTFGESTPQKYEIFAAVKNKIDTWFKTKAQLEYAKAIGKPLKALNEEIDDWPVVDYGNSDVIDLPLNANTHPDWKAKMDSFKVLLEELSYSSKSLSEEAWNTLKLQFGKFEKWKEQQSGGEIGRLGIERINEINKSYFKPELEKLIQKDLEHAHFKTCYELLNRALHLQSDLFPFVQNFVSFNDFYKMDTRAIFQTGKLYLDSRRFDLCLPVRDSNSHKNLADRAGIYLLYCELTRKNSPEKKFIAAAVTNGDSARLTTGKKGVFYDRHNEEWDATVISLLTHPINLKEAISEPFRRLGNLVTQQIEKISASREKAIQGKVTNQIKEVDASIPLEPDEKVTPPTTSSSAGSLLAGGGLAFAAIASSLTFLSSTLSRINPAYFFYSIFFFAFMILFPITLLAVLKLRKRDLGMLLEANGWAINGHLRLTFALGDALTSLPKYPQGFKAKDLIDKRSRQSKLGILLIVVLVVFALALPYLIG